MLRCRGVRAHKPQERRHERCGKRSAARGKANSSAEHHPCPDRDRQKCSDENRSVCDDNGVCIERCQPAEVRFVAFDRDDGYASSRECGDRIDRAGARIVELAHQRIAGRDSRANDIRAEAKGERQGDCERR